VTGATAEKKFRNEFTDHIVFEKGSKSTYLLNIKGSIKRSQITRSHECDGANKIKQEDDIEFKQGSTATYVLMTVGLVDEARIIRSHKCGKY
jgi:hypothetical protein